MTTKERLDELKKQTRECCCSNVIYDDEMDELLRLAKLGIWAREYGLPTLKEYSDDSNWDDHHVCDSYSGAPGCLCSVGLIGDRCEPSKESAKRALATLPKDSQ